MTDQSYDEISLKELIQTLINKRALIIGLTFLFLIMGLMYSLYQKRDGQSAQLILAFKFNGIENHLNPDGTKFDPYQVASPYVLNDVINTLDLEGKISPNEVRALIEVTPIIPEEVITKQEYFLEKEGSSFTYNPSEYILKVNAKASKNVSPEMAQKIANQIVASYRLYFTDTYLSQKPVVNKINSFNIESYDYADISMVLHSQLDEIKSFNTSLATVNPDFRSKRTGLTFSDINESLAVIDDIDMNRLDANISAYKLTKNKEKLILYYEYMVKQLEYQKSKYSAETLVTKDMLASIEDSNNKILDSLSGNVVGDAGESYFNSLIMKTASTGTSVSSIQQEIDYYNREISELKSDTYILNFDKNEITLDTENRIAYILAQLKDSIETTNLTANEFYDQYLSNAFYAMSPAEIYSDVKLPLNLAISAILGLMLGCFIAFFTAYWESER